MPHDLAHTSVPVPHHDHDGQGDVPRPALIAAGALVAITIGLAASARLGILQTAPGPTALHTLVSFTVTPSGQQAGARQSGIQAAPLVIRNSATGATLARLTPKQDPFLRTTLHALIAQRSAAHRATTAPFILANGHGDSLILRDPTSGAAIDLAAFGTSNEAQFASLLPAAPPRHAASTGGTSP